MAEYRYRQCRDCAHFADTNPAWEPRQGLARYEHFEDGEQEFDHDARPSGTSRTLDEWKRLDPLLFETYPDGKIGPNSAYFDDRRGKADPLSIAEAEA